MAKVKLECENAKKVTEKTRGTYDGLRKERDYYKINFTRIAQEKAKIMKDFEKVRKVHETFEDKYNGLVAKYENLTKEKMLAKIEIDRLKGKTGTLQKQVEKLEREAAENALDEQSEQKTKTATRKPKQTPFPTERENPYDTQDIEKFTVREGTTLFKT